MPASHAQGARAARGAGIDVSDAALVGSGVEAGEVVEVDAEAKTVVAQLPVGVNAELLALIDCSKTTNGAKEPAAADRGHGTLGHTDARVDDVRAAERRVVEVADHAVVRLGHTTGSHAIVFALGLGLAVQSRKCEVVSQVARVFECLAAAAGLGEAGSEQRAPPQAIAARQTAINVELVLVRVIEGREFEQVVVADVPVELHQPGRVAVGAGNVGDGLRGAIHLVAGATTILQQGVAEQAILHQAAAGPDGRRSLRPRLVLAVVSTQRNRINCTRAHVIAAVQVDVRVAAAQGLWRQEEVCASLEIIGATLGDDVDDAACGATELGAIAASLHLLLGDRLEWDLGEIDALERVGNVEAVDEVLVFGNSTAAEGSEGGGRGGAPPPHPGPPKPTP